MGSDGHVLVVGGDGPRLVAHAEARLRLLEDRWTRFSPDSELSRLNRRAGSRTRLHPDTFALVARACDGWRLTGGLFDPTVLPAMIDAGYTRPLDASGRTGDPRRSTVASAPGCGSIELDPAELSVTLPGDVALDPGGLGKGLAADLVAAELLAMGGLGVLVNVGGDLRAEGTPPSAWGWTVAIEDPFDADSTIATPRFASGAVATTTPRHRRWMMPSGPATHVIDPRNGRPVETDVASATVIAGQAWMAEVVAKGAAISGVEGAIDVIDEAGLSGIVVSDTGAIRLSARLGAFL
jgi:FAD:protein FMN transferase